MIFEFLYIVTSLNLIPSFIKKDQIDENSIIIGNVIYEVGYSITNNSDKTIVNKSKSKVVMTIECNKNIKLYLKAKKKFKIGKTMSLNKNEVFCCSNFTGVISFVLKDEKLFIAGVNLRHVYIKNEVINTFHLTINTDNVYNRIYLFDKDNITKTIAFREQMDGTNRIEIEDEESFTMEFNDKYEIINRDIIIDDEPEVEELEESPVDSPEKPHSEDHNPPMEDSKINNSNQPEDDSHKLDINSNEVTHNNYILYIIIPIVILFIIVISITLIIRKYRKGGSLVLNIENKHITI